MATAATVGAAMVGATATQECAAVAIAAAPGLLRRSFLRNHWRGSSLSFISSNVG